MKILVIGATGTIGKAVVRLSKEKGHEVIEASRSLQPSVDLADASSIDRFYESLEAVDAVIITAGDAAFAALDQLNDAQIELSLNSKLGGQINMVRQGLQKLRPNGVFVITGGMLAYAPWPQTSMLTM